MALAGRFEFLDDPIALGWCGIDRNEIVVVQVHTPRANLGEHGNGIVWREGGADDVAKRIAAAIADGPESEGELVLGEGSVGGHG